MFGDYKSSFKQTNFYQKYFIIPIICKIIIGCILGIFNGMSFGGLCAIGVVALELILTAALRPFL